MFSSIHGSVLSIGKQSVVIEAAGLGYEIKTQCVIDTGALRHSEDTDSFQPAPFATLYIYDFHEWDKWNYSFDKALVPKENNASLASNESGTGYVT